jgi:hypothetical protein
MKDKLKIGLIAGIYATIFKEISNILSIWIIHAEHTYWDYAGFIAFNQKPHGINLAIAIFIQIFFSISLAAIYSYGVRFFPTKLYLIRGSMFGGAVWFSIQAILFVLKISKLVSNKGIEALWEFVTAIIFGMIVSYMVEKMMNKNGIDELEE